MVEAIRDQGERQLEGIRDFSATHGPEEIKFRGEENQKSEILNKDIKEINSKNRTKNFTIVHSNKTVYDFNEFRDLNQFL